MQESYAHITSFNAADLHAKLDDGSIKQQKEIGKL